MKKKNMLDYFLNNYIEKKESINRTSRRTNSYQYENSKYLNQDSFMFWKNFIIGEKVELFKKYYLLNKHQLVAGCIK